MPIQYGDSIMEATKHCRSSASIFDVSHMLGSFIRGKAGVAVGRPRFISFTRSLAQLAQLALMCILFAQLNNNNLICKRCKLTPFVKGFEHI